MDNLRSFLNILNTYRREKRGIYDVLGRVSLSYNVTFSAFEITTLFLMGIAYQVSNLFADHIDLLMEFTNFLPEALQEQVGYSSQGSHVYSAGLPL